jgi:alpha-tubulin suppressor-like RCC1 family protein
VLEAFPGIYGTYEDPIEGVTSIANGLYHVLMAKDDGSVWALGYNFFGECGRLEPRVPGGGENEFYVRPVIGLGPTNVNGAEASNSCLLTRVAAGGYHSYAWLNPSSAVQRIIERS